MNNLKHSSNNSLKNENDLNNNNNPSLLNNDNNNNNNDELDLYTIPVDILGAASSATISLDLQYSKATLRNEENEPLFVTIEEGLKVLEHRHLPLVNEWIDLLIKYEHKDKAEQDKYMKKVIDIKEQISEIRKQTGLLGLKTNTKLPTTLVSSFVDEEGNELVSVDINEDVVTTATTTTTSTTSTNDNSTSTNYNSTSTNYNSTSTNDNSTSTNYNSTSTNDNTTSTNDNTTSTNTEMNNNARKKRNSDQSENGYIQNKKTKVEEDVKEDESDVFSE